MSETPLKIPDIEMAALKDEPLPDGAAWYERLLWYELRELDRRRLPYYEAKKRRNALISEYRALELKNENMNTCTRERASFWKNIEAAANSYATNPTPETCSAFYNKVYGLLPKE